MLREASDELHLKHGWSSITLSGFSAGYGAVREILRSPEYFAQVNNVLLLDGMHAGYLFLFQLPNPLLQELPLRFLLGQRQSFLIRGPGLSCPTEPAVHICTGGMRQVIICQFAMLQQRVDMRQTGLWTIALCNCHGTI
jgi:hypothetical protein